MASKAVIHPIRMNRTLLQVRNMFSDTVVGLEGESVTTGEFVWLAFGRGVYVVEGGVCCIRGTPLGVWSCSIAVINTSNASCPLDMTVRITESLISGCWFSLRVFELVWVFAHVWSGS